MCEDNGRVVQGCVCERGGDLIGDFWERSSHPPTPP